jgi:hypothetical protein
MLVGGILLALGVLGIVIVHFRPLDQLFRQQPKANQPPVDIKRR